MKKNEDNIIEYLDTEIKKLSDLIKNTKRQNDILKLNIQKKELLLQKMN